MHRLFAAIRPPAFVRAQLLALMHGISDARWQDDDQLHITLRFIGEVETMIAEDVATALNSVDFPGFDVALSGVGIFSQGDRRGSLWVGITPAEQLAALHRKIDAVLVRLGLEPERRKYLPHITIARLNRSSGPVENFIAAHAGLTSEPFPVRDFSLIESTLEPDGARYETVAQIPLRIV
jgi:2'-5' RNA ligase